MVQATNLLRALRQSREAGALGLLEGQAQRSSTLGDALVNASRDASLRRRAQSLQRFMLQQLHREGAPAGAPQTFLRYASQLAGCWSCADCSIGWLFQALPQPTECSAMTRCCYSQVQSHHLIFSEQIFVSMQTVRLAGCSRLCLSLPSVQ